MQVDVSSILRDSTSDQITEVKIEIENHNSGKGINVPECGIRRSDNDKKAGESCIMDGDNINPVKVEKTEEVDCNSQKKKQGSVCANISLDDKHKCGEDCMANETNSKSSVVGCLGEVQCQTKRASPGKRKREALCFNDQSKSISEDDANINEASAAEIGSNITSGSIANGPNLAGDTISGSCTEQQGTKRMKSNKDKQDSCNDTDNVDDGNILSALVTVCRPKSTICNFKNFVTTEEVPVTENRADLGGVIGDDPTELPGSSTAESNTILQYQRKKKNDNSERQDISDCNVHEPTKTASTFYSECTASSNNCNSKDAAVTEEIAVIDSSTAGENKKKKMKSTVDAAGKDVIHEGSPKNKQKGSPSGPIRSVTTIMHVTSSVTAQKVELSLSCTSEVLVLKHLVPPGKRKLLVLDINGLLADINQDYSYAEDADFKISGKLVFKRPFCADFLNFCFANFEIGVWSSRNKYNVQKAVQYLMGDLRNKLLFCWDQSKCTATNFNTIDNSRKPLVFKELKKLWEKEEPDLPWEKGQYTPKNTLLVDDSPYKAFCNPPFTAIFPPPYSFKHKEDNSLGIGGDLRGYLEKLAMAEHVQYFVKDNPFGQPPITDSHPNWKFYLRIIEDLDKPVISK